jgi:hypothetical protein
VPQTVSVTSSIDAAFRDAKIAAEAVEEAFGSNFGRIGSQKSPIGMKIS